MERDRVIADRDPQPGAARAVFPAKFLDAPAGLVGMAQRRLVLVRKDRLATRHGIGEARLDQWLRERRFVDLYAVVRGGATAPAG